MNTGLSRITDDELLKQLHALLRDERSLTAQIIEHLAECRCRDLHRKEGYPSLFQYCIEVLGLSEHAAYDRICAAKCSVQFPVILEKLAKGSVNLTTIRLLAPHLTRRNHMKLLDCAQGKTKLEVMEIVASLHPQLPVPSSIRKLTESSEKPAFLDPNLGLQSTCLGAGPTPTGVGKEGFSPDHGSESVSQSSSAVCGSECVDSRRGQEATARRSTVRPLAPKLYKVQFTAGAETHQKLRQLQDLLRHQVPSGDLAVIIDMALSDLLEKVMKHRLGSAKPRRGIKSDVRAGSLELSDLAPNTNSFQNESEDDKGHRRALDEGSSEANPRGQEAAAKTAGEVLGKDSSSRYIPKSVRKEVWKRDGGRCAFLSQHGQRCPSRAWLEFHHVMPYAWGGKATTQNIELRCRAHNAFEGALLFGSRGKVQQE